MTMVRRQGDWLSARVGDELVMMSAASRHYVGLSEVGARIWELIEQPRSLDEVCARLVEEYDVAPDVWDIAGHVSPNPGGVGPLTRAFLLTNVVERAERA